MSTDPTRRYLIEHADTLYRMREEMDELEPLLARDLGRGIASLAERRNLVCVEGAVVGDGELRDSTSTDEEDDLIYRPVNVCHTVFNRELRLSAERVVGVTFWDDLEPLLRGTAEAFVRIDLSPLSTHLNDLQAAKELWSSAGAEEFFANHPSWTTYTNNRVPHTYWGARVPDSPPLSLADLARAWDLGKVEDALGFVEEALDVYQKFAKLWKKSIAPRLGSAERRRSA